ncbi:retrovirus-related pol polyprotein from transposon TNT 1-94 [Tanacetum coccineum]
MKTSSHRFKGSLRFGFRLALSRLQQTGAYGFKGLLIFLRFIKAIHGEKGYLDVTIPPSHLHTTNSLKLNAYLEQHELHANEVCIMRERSQDPLAVVANHQMETSHFKTYQSSYNNPQFQQQFSPSQSPQYGSIHPTQHYPTTYQSIPFTIPYPLELYPNAYSSTVHQDAYSGLAVPVFKQGDDPIDAINTMMSFLSIIGRQSSFATRTSGTRANILGTRGNNSGQQRVVKCFNCQGEGHMARQWSKPKRKRDATWFRDKVLLVEAQGAGKALNEEELAFLADPGVAEGPVTQTVITHNAVYQADDLDAYAYDCNDISTAKAVLMANLSSYGSNVLSEVPHSENTHNDMLNQSVQEMPYSEQTHLVNYPENEITSDSNIIPYSQYLLETQNAAVQDTNSSAQQDAMILSVFEQLSNQVTNCNKVNKDNLIANESLSAELERYKERVKLLEERQNVDLSTREKLIMDDIIREKNAQFADFEKEINYLKQTLSEQSKEKELLTKTFNVFKNESKEKEAKNIDKEIALEKKVKELDNIVYKMGQSAQTVHMLTKPQVFYDNNLKQALGFQNPFYLKKAQQIRPMLYDGSVIAKETNVISIADSEETLMLEEESRSKMLLKQSDPMVLEKKVNIKPINYAELNRLSEDFGKRFVPQQELSDEQAFWLQTSHPNTDQSASSPVKIKAPRELPKTYKQLYDSIKPSRVRTKEHVESLVNQLNQKSVEITDLNAQLQEKVYVITVLKNDLRKLKGKDIVDNAAQVLNATTIALGMYKLDSVTLAPKDKNNKETHIYYLKHTMEQAAILREIVEEAKSLNPFDSASYSSCKYVKLIQELLGYVRDTCPDIHKPSKKLVAIMPINKKKTVRSKSIDNTKNDRILQISSSTQKKNKVEDHSRIVKSCLNKPNCVVEPSGNANVQHSKLNTNSEPMYVKCNSSMFDARHELCFLEFVSDMNASSKSKSVKKAKKKEEWKLQEKCLLKLDITGDLQEGLSL